MTSSQRIITTSGTQKGQWTRDEDERLIALIHIHGASGWKRYNGFMDGRRSAKQCRERWHQNLDPALNHKPILPEEGEKIIRLVDKHGQKWAKIAKELNNHRSDNHVKNWWNGSQNKAQRSLTKTNIAVNSAKPRAITPFDHREYHQVRNLMYSKSGLLPSQPSPFAMAPPSLNIPSPLSIHPPHDLAPQSSLPSSHLVGRSGAFVTPTRATFDLPQLSPTSTSTLPTNSPVTPPAGTYASFHRHYLPQSAGQLMAQPPKPVQSIPTADLDGARDLLTLAKHAPLGTGVAACYPTLPLDHRVPHQSQPSRHSSSYSQSGRISIANLMN